MTGSLYSFPIVLQHETLEAMLERGERLDDLVAKTDKLSTTSKAFYKEVWFLHFIFPLSFFCWGRDNIIMI